MRFPKQILLLAISGIVLALPAFARAAADPDVVPPHDVISLATATFQFGLSPTKVRGAYGFDRLACATPPAQPCGTGQTIAIVDAYDSPTVEADLATFSTQFGLPACTTANGCFTKATPQGAPPVDGGWALEIALDVQWAHAIAPGAKILLVESADARISSLVSAVDYAVAQGAKVVSMSWGSSGEFAGETSYDGHFNVAGVSFVASSGDDGHALSYPAVSPYVTAVGGTTLALDGSGAVTSETAWSGSGGGVSAYEARPSYQASIAAATGRGVPDVSLVADPGTGVAVYDSTPSGGQAGWFVVGGTSASAPMWGALLATANAARASTLTQPQTLLYGATGGFRDIVSGTNGACGALCAAGPGYDFVTGLGSAQADLLLPVLSGTASALSFASAAPSLTAGTASGALSAQLSANATADTAVTLHTTSSGGGFSTAATGPWTATLAVTIANGTRTTPSFHYRDTRAGTATLTATAPGALDGSQTATVVAAAPTSLSISPAGAVALTVGATQVYASTGTDPFGNTAPVAAAWTVTPSIGTFSGSTFTAAAAGSGTISAAASGLTATAAVSVAAAPAPAPAPAPSGGGGGGGGAVEPAPISGSR